MARLKISERIRITQLAADKLRRGAMTSVLNAPPFRWQFGASASEQLLIVPQDLRTADPSFLNEVEVGQYGLAGAVAHAEEISPFDIKPPTDAWARELHGFGWLRHLTAAARPEGREIARLLATEWALRYRGGSGVAWEPHVTGRRLISWISHSSLLLEDADPETYEILTESLGVQLIRLAASWRNSPSGYQRLLSLATLLLAQLCISGHEGQIPETEKLFVQELHRQILPDGGHIGRNPGVLVELILDLLPLNQCFAARSRTAPPELGNALKAMLAMLKYMRLGDGMLGAVQRHGRRVSCRSRHRPRLRRQPRRDPGIRSGHEVHAPGTWRADPDHGRRFTAAAGSRRRGARRLPVVRVQHQDGADARQRRRARRR